MQCTYSQWLSDATMKLHSYQNTWHTPAAQVATPLQEAPGTEPSPSVLKGSVASSVDQGPRRASVWVSWGRCDKVPPTGRLETREV